MVVTKDASTKKSETNAIQNNDKKKTNYAADTMSTL